MLILKQIEQASRRFYDENDEDDVPRFIEILLELIDEDYPQVPKDI